MFNQRAFRLLAIISLSMLSVTAIAEMRKWKDASGLYSVTAQYVTADDKLVVLEKQDGELEILQREQLSPADRQYLAEHRHEKPTESVEQPELPSDISTWHLHDGSVIPGTLMGFGSQRMIVRRERGDLWVNDHKLDDLPLAYAKVVPMVVSVIDNKPIEDLEELESHIHAYRSTVSTGLTSGWPLGSSSSSSGSSSPKRSPNHSGSQPCSTTNWFRNV